MSESPTSVPTLQVTARIDRPLVRASGGSRRLLAVDVVAPKVESKKEPAVPLNLALVIDASGSMNGEPIEFAKEAAWRVAQGLGGDDTLSVVSFDDEVTVHVDAQAMDATGRARVESAIAAIRSGGSTDLGGGWLRGCELVARAMEGRPGLRNRVVLLSDGHANCGITDPAELAAHASELRKRGLLSSTVGVGEGYSDAQLEAISASGGGRLHHAARPEEIVELVLAELEESRETVVDSCDLVVELPEGVDAEVLGDYEVRREGRRLICAIGSLLSGAERTVVARLAWPAGQPGATGEVAVHADWKSAAGTGRASATAAVEFADGSRTAKQPRDGALALRIARLWQLAVVRQATRLNQQGDLARAGKLVERELRRLRRFCTGLEGAKPLLEQLALMRRSVAEVVYARYSAKEMLVYAKKGLRSEREHRTRAVAEWSSHLPR